MDIADLEEDKALLLSMGHIEVEEWVEEEEELFPEDDDAEFLAAVEEFETGLMMMMMMMIFCWQFELLFLL